MKAYPLLFFSLCALWISGTNPALANPDLNWQQVEDLPLSPNTEYCAVAHADDVWMVGTTTGELLVSRDDGESWSAQQLQPDHWVTHFGYNEGHWIAMGGKGKKMYWSANAGDTWTPASVPVTAHLDALVYAENQWVAAGWGYILISDDGKSFSKVGERIPTFIRAAAYGEGTYVLVGEWDTSQADPRIYYSTDGASTWTVADTHPRSDFNDVAYHNGAFIAVGTEGKVYRSTDGNTWEAIESGTSKKLYGVKHAGGTWLAAGSGGTILGSDDGLKWEATPSPSTIAALLDIGATRNGERWLVAGTIGSLAIADTTDTPSETGPESLQTPYFNSDLQIVGDTVALPLGQTVRGGIVHLSFNIQKASDGLPTNGLTAITLSDSADLNPKVRELSFGNIAGSNRFTVSNEGISSVELPGSPTIGREQHTLLVTLDYNANTLRVVIDPNTENEQIGTDDGPLLTSFSKLLLRTDSSNDVYHYRGIAVSTNADEALAFTKAHPVSEESGPVLVTEPEAPLVRKGGELLLSVEAEGEGLAYQWKKNGEPIPGATSAEYQVAEAGPADEGSYTVVVSNLVGSTESAATVFQLAAIESYLDTNIYTVENTNNGEDYFNLDLGQEIDSGVVYVTFMIKREGPDASASGSFAGLQLTNSETHLPSAFDLGLGNGWQSEIFGIFFEGSSQLDIPGAPVIDLEEHIIIARLDFDAETLIVGVDPDTPAGVTGGLSGIDFNSFSRLLVRSGHGGVRYSYSGIAVSADREEALEHTRNHPVIREEEPNIPAEMPIPAISLDATEIIITWRGEADAWNLYHSRTLSSPFQLEPNPASHDDGMNTVRMVRSDFSGFYRLHKAPK